MRTLFVTVLSLLSINLFAASVCEKLENEAAIVKELSSNENVLTRENWNSIDVIVEFDYNQCLNGITQELILIDGVEYYQFRSVEDSCDGENTYGAIYSKDLKTPIAHIYDGDIYCQESWNDEAKAENHKCNRDAEALAKQKMMEFGFDMEVTSSYLELRKPYIWSFVHVGGTLNNKNDKYVSVTVYTRVDTCEFSAVKIDSLNL